MVPLFVENWFPFCGLKDRPATGRGTPFPVPVSLRTAMDWYWRVRRWDVQLQHSLDERGDNNKRAYTVGQPVLVSESIFPEGVDHPACFSSGRLWSWQFSVESLRDETGSGEFGAGYSVLSFSFGLFTEDTYWRDPASGLVWPSLVASGWLDSLSPGAPKVQQQLDPQSSFTVAGVRIPVYVHWLPSWEPESGWSATGGTQITLTPDYF